MKLWKAIAHCNCGKTTIVEGMSDEEEAEDMAKMEHHADHLHFFEGEMNTSSYETVKPAKASRYTKGSRR